MTLKTRLWNWEAGLDASQKKWEAGMRSWQEYLASLREAKEAEAKTMTHKELEEEFVELSIVWASLLAELNMMRDTATRGMHQSDIFAEKLFPFLKGTSKGGHAHDAKTGNKAQREEAQEEWPHWEPLQGKRTKTAYFDYFRETHDHPAELSRMYKWLKGLK